MQSASTPEQIIKEKFSKLQLREKIDLAYIFLAEIAVDTKKLALDPDEFNNDIFQEINEIFQEAMETIYHCTTDASDPSWMDKL